MGDPKRVAILISGRGSNMRALVAHANAYEVVLVASTALVVQPETARMQSTANDARNLD